MTNPGGGIPGGSYGPGAPGSGLAALATRTEESWREETRGKYLPHFDLIGDFGTILRRLINGVVSALGGDFQPLVEAINDLIPDPPTWLDIDGWVAGFFATLGDINDSIRQVFIALAGLVEGIPFVGDELSEILENIANFLNSTEATASNAATTAGTANTNATNALSVANAANSAVGAATSAASAAQTAASNAASVAAAAQQTADKAYANAQYDLIEFAVSTAGVILGTNEEPLGIILTKPTGWNRIITRVIYSMKTNNNTLTVQLMRRALNGTETVVHTTAISSSAITYPDNTIDYTITDLDHYFCNVSAVAGAVNTLHCALETVLVEA